jgi:hypothetical protein
MPISTTIRVTTATRDAVRDLAELDGVTLDEQINRLARAERQRRMGRALAEPGSADDDRWVEVSLSTALDESR